MNSWNVEHVGEDEYVLMNKNRTVIRMSEHAVVDLGEILAEIEEAGVPISFTDGLKEIYFTILKSDEKTTLQGDYKNGVIRISTAMANRDEMAETFVHELGHYVDEVYDISLKKKIIEEKPKKARLMPDDYARKNIEEYVACGFELYYFGTREQRGAFRRNNPKLCNVIRYLDRRNSR